MISNERQNQMEGWLADHPPVNKPVSGWIITFNNTPLKVVAGRDRYTFASFNRARKALNNWMVDRIKHLHFELFGVGITFASSRESAHKVIAKWEEEGKLKIIKLNGN